MLTFVRPTDRKSGSNIIWEALCECGNTTYTTPNKVINGDTVSCGCRLKELGHILSERNRKYDPKISSARARWRKSYTDIPFDTFLTLSQQPCTYCGSPPKSVARVHKKGKYHPVSVFQRQEGDFTYNGLDRIDSSKEHTADNVVPCCRDCNLTKSDKTLEEFLAHIERMYEYTRPLRNVAACRQT